jgi:uncharacterized protein (TIGR00369 family)
MTARDDLIADLDGLTDAQLATIRSWVGVMRRPATTTTEESVGALGDLLGIKTVSREPGKSRMRLDIDPAWHNPNGVLHGGVVYTMVDYSMGGAVQPALPEGQFCATIECKISYLATVREGTLTVETDVVKQGRNIAFTESKVTDDQGRVIATATGSMFIMTFG